MTAELARAQRTHWQSVYRSNPHMYGEQPSAPARHAAEVFAAYSGRPLERLPVLCSLEITERVVLTPTGWDRLVRRCGRTPPRWSARKPRTEGPLAHTGSDLLDLLSDAPIRPVVAPAQREPQRLRAAPPLVPGVVSFPPMPDAYTGPLPVVEEVFDQ